MKKILSVCVLVSAMCNAMEDNNKTQISFPDKVLLNIFCQAAEQTTTYGQALNVFKALQLTCKVGTSQQLMAEFEDIGSANCKAATDRIYVIVKDIEKTKSREKEIIKQQRAFYFDELRPKNMPDPGYTISASDSGELCELQYERELRDLRRRVEARSKYAKFFYKKIKLITLENEQEKANQNI